MDPDRRVFGDGAEPVLRRLRLHEAGPHVIGESVAWHVLVRAGHAVTRDRAEDDARIDLAQSLVAESTTLEPSGTHRFDDRVGIPHEVEVRVDAFRRAQVEHDRSLAAADVEVHQRHAFHDRPGHLADVVALGRFDLDDLSAEISEMGGDGAGAEHRALDNPYAVERRGGVAHGRTPHRRDTVTRTGSRFPPFTSDGSSD